MFAALLGRAHLCMKNSAFAALCCIANDLHTRAPAPCGSWLSKALEGGKRFRARLQSFFSPTWQQCTRQLVLSFFATVLPETPLPTILQLQADRQAAQRCAADVAALRKENAHLHECLRASQQQHGQVAHSDADLQHEGSHSADGSGGEEGVELKDMRACSSSGSTELRISEWSPPNMRMSADSEARATTSHSAPPGLAAGAASAPAPAVDSVVSGEAATGAARASGTGSARKAVHGAAGASASSRVRGAGSGAIKAAGAPAGHDRPKGGASPGAAASEEPTLCTSDAQQESPQQTGLAARGQRSSDAHAGGLEPAGRSEVRNDNGAEPLAHRERQGTVGAQRHRFHAAQPRKALPVADSMPAQASQSRPDG